MMRKNLLFIAWDSPEANYLEGLFMPIFAGLATEYNIHIIQFTWGSGDKAVRIGELCRNNGLTYIHHPIYRKPIATAGVILTVLKGTRFIKKYILDNNIDIVMPRSTMPALMVLRVKKSLQGVKIVFDADGLPLEERVDFAGLKKSSFQYSFLKNIESRMIAKADIVLARTQSAVSYLAETNNIDKNKFHAVINGRDASLFKPGAGQVNTVKAALGIPAEAILLVYAGSLGPQYCFAEMISIYRAVKQLHNNCYLLLLTGSGSFIENNKALLAGIEESVLVKQVAFTEMPKYLAAADAALALRRNFFSMKGVAPIKVGEYFLSGLPVILTPNTGDTETIFKNNEACFFINYFEDNAFDYAAKWILANYKNTEVKKVARTTGETFFSLQASVQSYKQALNALK
jgi:glycosyltransferase involved in cell wall biosynthesis